MLLLTIVYGLLCAPLFAFHSRTSGSFINRIRLDAASTMPDNSLNTNPYQDNFEPSAYKASNPLVIFVVDTSAPGGGQRIEAVKVAVVKLLPATRVSVIACSYNYAETILEPTSSLISAARKLNGLGKSVKGNLAAGIMLSIAEAKKQLLLEADSVLVTILADGNAHGLIAGSHGCDLDEEALHAPCDNDLYDSAMALATESLLQLNQNRKVLTTVLIDTAKASGEANDSGVRLSKACQADYFLVPQLGGDELTK